MARVSVGQGGVLCLGPWCMDQRHACRVSCVGHTIDRLPILHWFLTFGSGATGPVPSAVPLDRRCSRTPAAGVVSVTLPIAPPCAAVRCCPFSAVSARWSLCFFSLLKSLSVLVCYCFVALGTLAIFFLLFRTFFSCMWCDFNLIINTLFLYHQCLIPWGWFWLLISLILLNRLLKYYRCYFTVLKFVYISLFTGLVYIITDKDNWWTTAQTLILRTWYSTDL